MPTGWHGRHERFGGRLVAWIALALLVGLCHPARAGDPQAGRKLYAACKTCHQIGEGARNRVGPHLDAIVGRPAGSVDGFSYSKAMREAGENGLVWTADSLDSYIARPRSFIPGNRMSFRGMADAGKRADLIAYLATLSAVAPAEDPAQAGDEGAGLPPGFAEAVLSIEGDPDYGEYLASECVTCHQVTGHADGIPSIIGLPRDYFVRALLEYRNNIRTNEVMKLRVTNLANEEIAALAAYFSALQPD